MTKIRYTIEEKKDILEKLRLGKNRRTFTRNLKKPKDSKILSYKDETHKLLQMTVVHSRMIYCHNHTLTPLLFLR